jgi:putative transcriptional regulator
MITLNLEQLLKERGRTFYWLAKEAKVNQTVMSRMRHQKVKAITLDVLDRICAVLECEPGDVLIRVSDKPRRARAKRRAEGNE